MTIRSWRDGRRTTWNCSISANALSSDVKPSSRRSGLKAGRLMMKSLTLKRRLATSQSSRFRFEGLPSEQPTVLSGRRRLLCCSLHLCYFNITKSHLNIILILLFEVSYHVMTPCFSSSFVPFHFTAGVLCAFPQRALGGRGPKAVRHEGMQSAVCLGLFLRCSASCITICFWIVIILLSTPSAHTPKKFSSSNPLSQFIVSLSNTS